MSVKPSRARDVENVKAYCREIAGDPALATAQQAIRSPRFEIFGRDFPLSRP